MIQDTGYARPACAAGLCLWLGLALFGFSVAHAEIFVEDFTTKTYCDTLQTTAWWDTDAGELKLHPFELELVGGAVVPGEVRDFALAGNFAYLAVENGGFQVIDISDPEAPVHVGGVSTTGFPMGLAIDGDFAFVATISHLLAIDISDPLQPVIVASLDGLSEATDLVIAGDYAYVASGNAGLVTVDITVPGKLSVVGGVDTPGFASSVALFGDYAYVTDGYLGIAVIDISQPLTPVYLLQLPASYHPERICIAGKLAFVAEISSELLVYSLLDPAAPALIGACALPGHALDVDVDGLYAYVTVADNSHTGLYAVDVSDPTVPQVIADITPPGFPIGVTARGEHAFVNCFYDGLQVVRVADRTTPVEVGSLLEPTTIRDLVVSGEIAYALGRSSSNHYFNTVSLADPTNPQTIGSLVLAYHGLNFVLHGPYAFLTLGSQGLMVVDVHDPANPSIVTTLAIDGSAIYIDQAGNYVYLGVLGELHCRLIVVDITDPLAPVQVAEMALASTPHGFAISGNYLFTSEHEDGASRFTEITATDITNPVSPVPAASLSVPDVFAGELHIEGNVLYASYWTPLGPGQSGVQLIDISDPLNMQPLGAYRDGLYFGSEICVAGDIAYLSGDTRRLDVLDVSDPMNPTVLHLIPTTFVVGCMEQAGDFLFCGANYGGFNSMQAFDRRVNQIANAAQSLPLPTSGVDLAMIRLAASQQPTCAWEVSADGGAHWQAAPADGGWRDLEHQGPELLWRAALFHSEFGYPPRVDQLELEWTYVCTAVPEATPSRLALHQNAPNPFNPATTIRFELPVASQVTLEIVDVGGRLVKTLVAGQLTAGRHAIDWQGRDVAGRPVSSGIYLYRLTTPDFEQTRKMVLLQ